VANLELNEFTKIVELVKKSPLRAEVATEEVPAPMRLAPHALAMVAEVLEGDEDLANGRLVLLFDPAGQDAWDGTTRLVTFVRARIESDLANDTLLTQVGWSWLLDCLKNRNIKPTALSGTVTRTASESFGELDPQPLDGTIEIRASWTIDPNQADLHVAAWGDLLCQAAGLQPISTNATQIKKYR
jgi:hypothetical protein